MAKNKTHAYLYDEWEYQKELLKRQKVRLHAAESSQYNELYPKYNIAEFYRRRDFDIKESKKAIGSVYFRDIDYEKKEAEAVFHKVSV